MLNPESESRLGTLNPEQRRAAEHFEGPCLVLAGAGSGKTRVLTTRICHLIREHGVPADRILAVTFTNKAAGEMKERIARMLGAPPRGMWCGTFHSLGARILRRHAPERGWTRTFTIFDAEQALRAVKNATKDVGLDPKRWSPKAMRGEISSAKNQLITASEFAEQYESGFDLFLKNVAKTFPKYVESLREQNAMDFDDLLIEPVRLLESNERILRQFQEKFSFVLVDEYQDTNRAQFRFLELMAGGRNNLMVVGDDDQSIYGWRGADIRNILDFEKTYAGAAVVRLEQNYRSSEVILNAANRVIEQNQDRKGKTLRTDRIGGEAIVTLEAADESDEAQWIVTEIETRMLANPDLTHKSFAILYRTNAQARAMEDRFRRRGIPYQVIGGVKFYERREIQDFLGYLRLISNPRDRDAFDRVVNYPRRGVGKTSLERLMAYAEEAGIGLLEAALVPAIPGVSGAATRGLKAFAELIQRYSIEASRSSVGELIEGLIEDLDLLTALREEGPDGGDRANNIRELVAGAMDFEAERVMEMEGDDRDAFTDLDLFLQQVALVADVDRHDPDADTVTLMTLHNAKGLEFPVVFISGLEEGLFPLSRAYDEPSALEEERRLFYVGVTRAEDRLYFTHARQRRRAGEMTYGYRSSFVEAIAEGLESRRTDRVGPVARVSTQRHDSRPRRQKPREQIAEAPVYDESYNQDGPAFTKGERVTHETFGSGAILEITGFGRDLKVTVDFDTVGRKKLLVRYAALEKDYF